MAGIKDLHFDQHIKLCLHQKILDSYFSGWGGLEEVGRGEGGGVKAKGTFDNQGCMKKPLRKQQQHHVPVLLSSTVYVSITSYRMTLLRQHNKVLNVAAVPVYWSLCLIDNFFILCADWKMAKFKWILYIYSTRVHWKWKFTSDIFMSNAARNYPKL